MKQLKGKIVQTIPNVSETGSMYFTPTPNGKFKLSVSDDNGVVRPLNELDLVDASGDLSFTKQVVAKEDGTLGLVDNADNANSHKSSCFATPELVTTVKTSPVKYFRRSEDPQSPFYNILIPEFEILFSYRYKYRDIQVPNNQLENYNFFGMSFGNSPRDVLVVTQGRKDDGDDIFSKFQFVKTNVLQTSPQSLSFKVKFRRDYHELYPGGFIEIPQTFSKQDDYYVFPDYVLKQASYIDAMGHYFREPGITMQETITREYPNASTHFMSYNKLNELYEGEVVLFEGDGVVNGASISEVIIFKLPDWVYDYPVINNTLNE